MSVAIFARNFIQRLKTICYDPFCRQNSIPKKIQDGGGGHFEIHFNGHNSVTVEHIQTKFGTETYIDDLPQSHFGRHSLCVYTELSSMDYGL